MSISPQRRQEIIDALRRGTVPQRSLSAFAVGLDRFGSTVDDELGRVERGGAVFKAVRGEYGTGKTFFVRFLQERARTLGFATAEVQISETETPLHHLETVYRRMVEHLSTSDTLAGALRSILDGWFYALEQDVLAEGGIEETDADKLVEKTSALLETRLAAVTRTAPAMAAALRGYRESLSRGEHQIAEGLLAWLSGQPNVGPNIKRRAHLSGAIDHFGALSFLQGLLTILRDSGRPGLLVVLDEVETLQRVRSDVRDKGLNALRQWIDEVDGGRFPGLYLVITGTSAFYDGPQGVQRLPPLAQRLHVQFGPDERFDNPRAVQIRLTPFGQDRLVEVGKRIRDLYAQESKVPDRIYAKADDGYLSELAQAVAGELGGKVGVAPRIFLKKLVAEVLDRIDQFPDFDPRKHYSLTLSDVELTATERGSRPATSADDIDLSL